MAKNPSPSQLDPGQIVKRGYDESTDRFRVDAAISAPDGTSILIDATTDSIKVGNSATGPFLNINSDGSTTTQIEGPTNGPVTTTNNAGKISLDTNITGGVVSGTFQPSGLQVRGIITMTTIDNSQWYLAPASPLILRNNIQIQNPATSTSDIIWNYDNTAPLTSGLHVPPGGSYSVAIRGSIPVYITLAGAGTLVLPVEELQ